MSRVLLRGGRIGPIADTTAPPTAVAVAQGRVVWVGDETAGWDDAEEVIDLDGAWVGPAFVDAHVHVVQTGFTQTGLDLSQSRSREDLLDRLADHANRHPGVIVGQGWDETRWEDAALPDAAELERAAPGRLVLLARIDGHSSLASPALQQAVPELSDLPGWSASGRCERDAQSRAREAMADLVTPEQRAAAAAAAVDLMAARGVVAFHENAAPHIGPESDVALVRSAARERGLSATIYWGECGAIDRGRRLGVAGLAGDLVADGAFGSHTAALRAPYEDRPEHCGHAYLDAHQVAEHVVACTRAGLQAGFHCIGDAALDAIGEGFERAATELGEVAIAAAGHRLEHVEMPSRATIATLARLRVTASVQPVFDEMWGGPHQMYARRLGERWRETNPLAALDVAGVALAFGSDSPVTPVGPWRAVRAASHHHLTAHRLTPQAAFRAHTVGGWRAAGVGDRGVLGVGGSADLAVWDTPAGLDEHQLPRLGPDLPLPRLRLTMSAGRIIHREDI